MSKGQKQEVNISLKIKRNVNVKGLYSVCSTLWISSGKQFLEVFLFHFWKTSDVVLGLREKICTFNSGTNYFHTSMKGVYKTHLWILLFCHIVPPVSKPVEHVEGHQNATTKPRSVSLSSSVCCILSTHILRF